MLSPKPGTTKRALPRQTGRIRRFTDLRRCTASLGETALMGPFGRLRATRRGASSWCGWRESNSVGTDFASLRFSEGKPVFRGEIREGGKTSLCTDWHGSAQKRRKFQDKIETKFDRPPRGGEGVENLAGLSVSNRSPPRPYVSGKCDSLRRIAPTGCAPQSLPWGLPPT